MLLSFFFSRENSNEIFRENVGEKGGIWEWKIIERLKNEEREESGILIWSNQTKEESKYINWKIMWRVKMENQRGVSDSENKRKEKKKNGLTLKSGFLHNYSIYRLCPIRNYILSIIYPRDYKSTQFTNLGFWILDKIRPNE